MQSETRGGVSRHLLTRSARVAGAILVISTLSACLGDGGDDSAALVPLNPTASVTCKGYDNSPITVTAKTITVYNDSDRTIYPVLYTSPHPVDQWMQACERSTDNFSNPNVYKLFVNEGTGIPVGSSITITLPLYSQLAANTYITWWNGGRVILADRTDRLRTNGDAGGQNPDVPVPTPKDVSCVGQSTACSLTTYSNAVTPPADIYAQLAEYTFGDSIIPAGQSVRLLKPENVGYNISYVDHVYLPIAMEPAGNPYIGYSGSAVDLNTFTGKLNTFVTDPNSIGFDWSVYNLSKLKLPGGYNVFAEQGSFIDPAKDIPVQPNDGQNPPLLTVLACVNGTAQCTNPRAQQFGQAVQRMQDLWSSPSCVTWDPSEGAPTPVNAVTCPPELHTNLQAIHDFFKKSHTDYLTLVNAGQCPGPKPKDILTFNYAQALKHIYGWVPFNEGCGAAVNPLAGTQIPGWTGATIQPMYIEQLQYNYDLPYTQGHPELVFNPYVKLIHNDLLMNAYGFSVDDAVGFMSELGSGIILTVGGTNGLPNPGQFSYKNGFSVVNGIPEGYPENQPMIKKYGVCVINTQDPLAANANCDTINQDVAIPQLNTINGFRVGTVSSYPIRVAFTDVKDNVYTFTVNQQFVCPASETDPVANCPTNKDAIKALFAPNQACIVRDKDGNTSPNSAAWCDGANPNSNRDPLSRDPQTVKNYLSFGPLVYLR